MTPNTVSIAIYENLQKPPSKTFAGIPWFPGMTVLEAMVIGQAMNPGNFEFQVEYNSAYGAFVNKIDGTADALFWMVQLDGVDSAVGVSEAIIIESPGGQNVEIEWQYRDANSHAVTPQVTRKLSARPSETP